MENESSLTQYHLLESKITRLNQIGIALSSEHNLAKLLELILTEARRFTDADGGSLYIKEENRLGFSVAQTESLEKKQGGKLPFKSFYIPLTKESIAGYVAVTGEILNLPDVYSLPPTVEYRFKKDFDVKAGYRTKSMLAVPMRDHRGEVIGVVQLINSLDGGERVPFKKEYEGLVLSLASQAAVAIRNARLIEEVRNLFRSLVRYSAKAIDARSPHTAGHSGRVTKYAVLLAQAVDREVGGRLGPIHFTAEELEELRVAGWLHDIGKIGVKEAVLEKAMKLDEWQMAKIAQTFEAIKAHYVIQAQQEKIDFLATHQKEADLFLKIDERLRGEIEGVEKDWAFLEKMKIPGFAPPEDLNRLREISERTYRNTRGENVRFLTPFEHENLSLIRGNLTAAEFREIQTHVDQTILILQKIPFTKELENVPRYAAMHHEKLDGSGYPKGLRGDAIPIQPRMLCIADIYEALTASDRPYKKITPPDIALKILQEEAKAGKLDGDLVELVCSKKVFAGTRKEEGD